MQIKNDFGKHRIVVLGGSSAPCLLADGLKETSRKNLTAIVATTDTGSSTGVIRRNFSIPAPGDLRCVISRMSALRGSDSIFKDLFEYRLHLSEIRELDNMAFGNLFIAAMAQMTADFDKAIEMASRLLRVEGKVLPVTSKSATLVAILEDGKEVVGEEEIRAEGKARIRKLYLKEEGIKTTSDCIEAISKADLIVIGPGCLYTSLIACLVVKGVVEALSKARGKKVYICNTTTTPGQTEDLRIIDHVREVVTYLGDGVLDSVLINNRRPPEDMIRSYKNEGIAYMELTSDQQEEIDRLGPKLLSGDLIERGWKGIRRLHKRDTIRHDPKRIIKALLRLVIILLFLTGPFFSPIEAIASLDPKPPPSRLINEEGTFNEGWYTAPISDINLDEAQFEGIWGREPFLRAFRKKMSHLYRMDNQGVFLILGLIDAGYVGDFFCYLYEKEPKRLTSYRFRSSLGRGIVISPNSMEGGSGFSNDRATISFLSPGNQGKREIHGMIAKGKSNPSLLFNLTILENPKEFPPLVLVRGLPGSRGIYYHKTMGMKVDGKVIIGNKTYTLSGKHSSAILDWSAGYPLFRSAWHRASAVGQSNQGQQLAIDITLHKDEDKEEESTFYWIDGQLLQAKGLQFERKEDDQSWKISSKDGRIQLKFLQEEIHQERLDLGLLGYRLIHHLGRFQGELVSPDGMRFRIEKMFGVVEQMKAQW